MSKPGIKHNRTQDLNTPNIKKNKISPGIILYHTSEFNECQVRGYKYLKKLNLCDQERPLSEISFQLGNFNLKKETEGSDQGIEYLAEAICSEQEDGRNPEHSIDNEGSIATIPQERDPTFGPRLLDGFYGYDSNLEVVENDVPKEYYWSFLFAIREKFEDSVIDSRPFYPRRYLKYAGELIAENSGTMSVREVYEYAKDLRTFRTFSYRSESRNKSEIFFISQMLHRAKDLRALELELFANKIPQNEHFSFLKSAMRKSNNLQKVRLEVDQIRNFSDLNIKALGRCFTGLNRTTNLNLEFFGCAKHTDKAIGSLALQLGRMQELSSLRFLCDFKSPNGWGWGRCEVRKTIKCIGKILPRLHSLWSLDLGFKHHDSLSTNTLVKLSQGLSRKTLREFKLTLDEARIIDDGEAFQSLGEGIGSLLALEKLTIKLGQYMWPDLMEDFFNPLLTLDRLKSLDVKLVLLDKDKSLWQLSDFIRNQRRLEEVRIIVEGNSFTSELKLLVSSFPESCPISRLTLGIEAKYIDGAVIEKLGDHLLNLQHLKFLNLELNAPGINIESLCAKLKNHPSLETVCLVPGISGLELVKSKNGIIDSLGEKRCVVTSRRLRKYFEGGLQNSI